MPRWCPILAKSGGGLVGQRLRSLGKTGGSAQSLGAPPLEQNVTSTSQVVYIKKQPRREFLDMCHKDAKTAPLDRFDNPRETQTTKKAQDLKRLSLIA